jgi:hypothetical protein
MKAGIILPIALGLALCSVQFGYSQHIVPGIIAGASFNSVDLKEIPETTTNLSNINGIEAGLYLSFNAGLWYFKPMALASFLKGTATSSVDGIKSVESNFELTTLEIPVIVGFKLLPGISLEAGPSWNYLMSYTEEINGVNLDLNRNSLGYRAGLRATFSRLGVFAHYGGMVDVTNSSNYELNRPSRIIFGASFDLVSGN